MGGFTGSRRRWEESMRITGIDVSRWQGTLDWKKVKEAGIGFAIIRAAAGLKEDVKFRENLRGAVAAGIPAGAYLYSLAKTKAEARREAELLLKLVEGEELSYPLVYDIEDEVQAGLSREARTELVEAFCGKIEAAGRYAMVYGSKSWLEGYFLPERLNRYDKWVAQWSGKLTYTGSYGIWQQSNTGRVDGIAGNVDLNVTEKDYPALTALKKQKWQKKDGKWHYGEIRGSWKKIDGRWYYFGSDGAMATGVRKIGGKWYCLAEKTEGPLKEGQCLFTDGSGAIGE